MDEKDMGRMCGNDLVIMGGRRRVEVIESCHGYQPHERVKWAEWQNSLKDMRGMYVYM